MAAIRSDATGIRRVLAGLPCKQHGDDIQRLDRNLDAGKWVAALIAGVPTLVALWWPGPSAGCSP